MLLQKRRQQFWHCTTTQADTSGTAKALVASFQRLGPAFEVDQIVKVRDVESQRKMGVPGAPSAALQLCLPVRRISVSAGASGGQTRI